MYIKKRSTSEGLYCQPIPCDKALPATQVTATSATLNGTIQANNSATSYDFFYAYFNQGINTGSATPPAGPITGTQITPVTATLTNLKPSTTYTFSLSTASTAGEPQANFQTFTTPPQ